MPDVRYSRSEEAFILTGGARIARDDGGIYFAALESVSALRLSDLRHAFAQRLKDVREESENLLIAPVSLSAFDIDASIAMNVFLEVGAEVVHVGFEAFLQRDSWTEEIISDALAPAARRAGATIDTVTLDTAMPSVSSVVTFPTASPSRPPELFASVRCEIRTRGVRVGRAIEIGEALCLLLETLDSDGVTARAAFEWIRLGHPELLIDQYESDVLEVKTQPYDLTRVEGKVEFAEAIAALANGSATAVVIVGMKTVKDFDGDRIKKVTPIRFSGKDKQAWRQMLNARIFPSPEGLEWAVGRVDSDRAVIAILVPRQEDVKKPFLVQGTMVGRKYRSTYISIPRRTHDGTRSASAEWIHARMTGG